jgi:hypothetical protein
MQLLILNVDYFSYATLDRDRSRDLEMLEMGGFLVAPSGILFLISVFTLAFVLRL